MSTPTAEQLKQNPNLLLLWKPGELSLSSLPAFSNNMKTRLFVLRQHMTLTLGASQYISL